ncbi:MAG: Mth938-like domain-containing protein [Rickettsiales bacterium]
MDITPLIPEGRQIVHSYGSGRFKVSQIEYQGSIIVLPGRTISWSVDGLDDINLETLEPVLAEAPRIEILLIGCGAMMQLVPRALRDACRQKGLAVEAMDTGAACRTYNILAAEGRRVAAGLVALG